MHRATLLAHISAAEPSDRGRVVPWAEWGQRTTSVVALHHGGGFVCARKDAAAACRTRYGL